MEEVLRQGSVLVAAGKLGEAQSLYTDALTRFPQNPRLHYELGMIYFRLHDWTKAVDNYRNSLHGDSTNLKALFYLSESYFGESDLERARATIAQAAQMAPNDPQVCQKYGEYLTAALPTRKEGIEWLEKARRLNPSLEHIDFEIGKAQFDLTDFSGAIDNLQAALKKESGNGEADFYLAECWARLSDWQKAREYYSNALARGYTDAAACYGLGKSQVQLGDFAAALDSLKHALALQPSLVQAHFQLGKAYRELGRPDESQHEDRLFSAMNGRTDTSVELKSPENQRAWQHVKPLLEANRELEARQYLAGLQLSSPETGDSALATPDYLLGAMYFSMGRNPDALRVLTLARAQAPHSAHIAAYLAMVQLSSGQPGNAETNSQLALELDPSEPLALIGTGIVRYQQQKWTDAIDDFEKSRTADPGVLFMLCDAYFRVGRKQDAMLTAEVVRAFGSDRHDLMTALDQLLQEHSGAGKSLGIDK